MTAWKISRGNLGFVVSSGRVLPSPGVRHPPGAPEWLVGVACDGGRAIGVVDLAVVYGAAVLGIAAGRSAEELVAAVETPAGVLGLLSDAPPTRLTLGVPPAGQQVFVPLEGGLLWVDLPSLCRSLGAP